MDFLDPAKKRQHNRRLFIGYFLISIAVLTLSYLLILQSYGYDYDRHTGQVIQNGLVYVSSHPVKAEVIVNGKSQGTTNTKLTIPTGNYNFVLKSAGYRDWTTTINLDGGSVEQLSYPLLVPEKLITTDTQTYIKAPALLTASPDRHWLLVQRPDSLTTFDSFDINKPAQAPKTISLAANLLKTASGAQALQVVEWSTDNRHVLIKHVYQGGYEFIVVDRQNPALSYNVNTLLDVAPTSVVLRDKKFDQLYAYIAKTKSLISLNATTKQATTTLRHVIDYKVYGSKTILYTSDDTKAVNQYAVNIWDGQKSYLLHNYPAKTAYKLDMASYSGQPYVAVSPVSTNRLYVFKDPLPIMKSGRIPNPFIALKINNPQFVSFSTNSRFIVAQSGPNFSNYDLEKNLWHYFSLKDKLTLTDKAEWMDGHRLLINVKGKLKMLDFNGDNQQVLVTANDGFNGEFNSDYSLLFTLAPSVSATGKQALTQTNMVVSQ